MPPKGPKRDYREKRLEARRLFVEHHKTQKEIAATVGVPEQTIRRWSAQEKWADRRTEADLHKEQKSIRALRGELREQAPDAVRRNLKFVQTMLGRNVRLLVRHGQACKECGRGTDTDNGSYKASVGDTLALIKFEMAILGADGGMGGGEAIATKFPELPTEFVHEAAALFARYEGQIPQTFITPQGDVEIFRDGDDD